MNDCKYQYITKHEEERKKFKAKRAQGFNKEEPDDPRLKKSAAFLMLYKKGLESLCKEYEANNNGVQQRQIERELARTDGMTMDQSLNNFARDNSAIVKQLVLLQCNDFQRPQIKKMLDDVDNYKGIIGKFPSMDEINRLSRAKKNSSKARGMLKKNLEVIKGITST